MKYANPINWKKMYAFVMRTFSWNETMDANEVSQFREIYLGMPNVIEEKSQLYAGVFDWHQKQAVLSAVVSSNDKTRTLFIELIHFINH